ncbi:chromatin-remodelling complex, RSC SWI/SNF subunit Rsc7/Swp82, partial [Lophiotrema nucula]
MISASKPTVINALPRPRIDHANQLDEQGDEFVPTRVDEAGEKKVKPNGDLLEGREYKCLIFYMPNRGGKLFMLATECARVLDYRDSYLLFNKNPNLYKIILNLKEKDDLIDRGILPYTYRSRQIAIVTARSMFRQFGSRLIINGRRVRDDYW